MRIIRMRNGMVLLALAGMLGSCGSSEPSPAAARPNIILIMADDLGFSDLGCYGSEIRTPNLDRLAAEGLRFRNFYNTGRCCPTRASLLTGLYAHQAGVGHMVADRGTPAYRGELNRDCVTVAEALKGAGYRTDMVGKWHVSNVRVTGKAQINHQNDEPFWKDKKSWPLSRGFETFYGTILGVGDYFDPFSLTEGDEPLRDVPAGFYYTDAITDRAVERVTTRSRSSEPFFLYVAYTAPHWPLHARPEDIEKYRDVYADGWDALRRRRHERQVELGIVDPDWTPAPRDPDVSAWQDAPNREWEAQRMAVYAAQIDRLDQGVGRILKSLDAAGAAERTLVVFLSDNGGCAENLEVSWYDVSTATRQGRAMAVGNRPGAMPGPEEVYQSYGPSWANASNTPFRLHKRFVHEGGISTPFIVRWPAAIRERGKIRSDDVGHVIDLLPTFLDAAGATYPATYEGHRIRPVEGRSLLPAFLGKSGSPARTLFWEHEGNRAVRSGPWKLVARRKGPWELYDLSKDRTETADLSGRLPDKVRELSAAYQEWSQRVGVLP